MIHSVRDASKAKGNSKKEILDVEEELRRFATRSIQATQKILKGDILMEGKNIDVLRPGKQSRGVEARFLLDVSGKKAKRDYDLGVIVKPNSSAATFTGGAIAGGPVLGAGLVLIQKLFGLEQASHDAYTITGPWEAPVVKQISKREETKDK